MLFRKLVSHLTYLLHLSDPVPAVVGIFGLFLLNLSLHHSRESSVPFF